MPMTKKKRQLKRAKIKYFKNDKKNNKVDEISNNDIKIIDEIESETGSPLTPEKVDNYNTELNATPIRRRRVCKEKIPNESMNITNLNILFDSEFIYNAHSGNDVFISKTNSARKRSLSSISKFSSPVQGEPYRKHKYTQTPDKNDIVSPRYTTNEETPKCRKIFTMQKNSVIKNKLLSKKIKNNINFNPYLKNMESNNKDDSYSEASFFCPNLFQQYSSTPIQDVANRTDLVENLADAIFIPMTPKFPTNLNINENPKEKILKKEITIKSLKASTFNVSTTRSRSVKNSSKSPEKIHSTKLNGYFSNYDISKKSSMEISFNKTDNGCCDLFSRLKKYCKLTQHWTGKIVNVCFHLGLQLKNTVSSIYAAHNSLQGGVHLSCNKCKHYQAEVTMLSLKVVDIENVNKKLSEEIQQIRDEFSQFKNELKTMKNISSVPVIPPPPPQPPMPPMAPPPPPPPPPPPLMAINSNRLMISKKTKGGEDKENSRPVISLEDILKVKLKKAKPYQSTPISHHSNQPTVSIDMLRQVKLRPSSSKSVSIPDNESLDVTLSPNTNLCRLLKNDMSSGRRLKRLRKVGGLSYDSVYRRKFCDSRERNCEF